MLSPLGARGAMRGPLGASPVSLATSWWTARGTLANVDTAGAWAAKGAASLAASYLRLAGVEGNANLDPVVVGGGVAPTFDPLLGWLWNGLTQYLLTGIVPGNNWSVIVKFSLVPDATLRCPYGSRTLASNGMEMRIGTPGRYYAYGASRTLAVMSAGTMAIGGVKTY